MLKRHDLPLLKGPQRVTVMDVLGPDRFLRKIRTYDNGTMVSEEVVGEYRRATKGDNGRKDFLVVYDPENFHPFRVVPV